METERLEFLYGTGFEAEDLDLSDADVRSDLMERSLPPGLSPLQKTMREVIANQILDDEPPEVWSAVQRLQDQGADRESILGQLVLTFAPTVRRALTDQTPSDPRTYVQALSWLPLPASAEIEDAVVTVVSASPGITTDDAADAIRERLGRDVEDFTTGDLVDRVIDQLVDEGQLAWAAGDRLVSIGALTEGIVLTHALTAAERELGVVNGGFDLAGFSQRDDLTLPTGEPITIFSVEPGHLAWMGPAGWLEHCTAGSVLAIRIDPRGVVHFEALATPVDVDQALVDCLRSVYDQEVDAAGLPVHAEELLVGLLLETPDTFEAATTPLAELAEAAGLERRLDRVAHDDSVWHNGLNARRTWRLFDALEGDNDRVHKILHALDIADLVSGIDPALVPDVEGPVDPAVLRSVLADLHDASTLSALAGELFEDDDPGAQHRAESFVGALLAAASRPRDIAAARLLTALHAEQTADLIAAEQHLKLAHEADIQVGVVTDRLAWYASDRGDAASALRLWRELEPSPAFAQDLREVEKFAAPAHTPPGRNDPCWCGSGRKFKQCHLGATDLPPLPERVGWLCRKAVAYLERGAPTSRADVLDIAYARADDTADEQAIAAAFDDPIVLDLALTEGGWFERFLEDRGPLLPDDEALLAQSWVLVDRTVYEVVAVHPGTGLDLRDLRTAEVLEVRERTFSKEVSPGTLVCARAVPDGETHQFVGGLFPVAPGREGALLDLLDEGDPEEIATWVASLYRPPELRTREGEALVECEVLLEVGDEQAARAFLDATYEPDQTVGSAAGASWVELFPLNEDEDVLRARLRLEGTHLTVETNSEERANRVLEAIRAALADVTIVRDDRTPLDLASVRTRAETGGNPHYLSAAQAALLDDPEMAEALAQMRDRYEERWCDESIPALDGYTPRQAADDPTRRQALERLLTSFDTDPQPSTGAMRPARLRNLLGL